MKKIRTESNRLAELRKRAVAMLEQDTRGIPVLSPEEARNLVHELRTHQIELEIQNEELRSAHEELVESRDRYSDLYDFAPIGYMTVNHKGLIIEANLALAEMLGVERQVLVNHPLSDYIIPDDQDVFYRYHRKIQESKQHDTCQMRMLRRAAAPFWVEMDSILIKADDESDGRLRSAIIDITDRKRVEEEKLALGRQAQHAQKLESLGLMAGGIAHDFNNLLTTILGNAGLALEELPPLSPTRTSILEIEKASRRAAELAKQMLAYSGKGRFVIKPIDARQLVEEMAYLLNVSISKKAVLKLNFAEDMPTFDGDATQIRQVIINLIINASEAIGDGVGVITLSTGAMDCDRSYLDGVNEVLRASLNEPLPEGVYVYFEVADTGCGMDAETMGKISDPFFSTKFTGRGLGISAVLGIVRGHKGGLTIHSEVGKGTTFRVLFPANETTDKGMAVRIKSEVKEKDWRGSGTILIVDDVEAVRGVGKRMLESMGFSVLTASDGLEGLKVFCQHAGEIVCVLLDLTMPHMDGEETFQEMRRIQPGVTVILCSGYHEQDATERFAGKGLAGFLQKPFGINELKARLMEVVSDDKEA